MSDFVLVPRIPTEAMLTALGFKLSDGGESHLARYHERYAAMIAAAPPAVGEVWRLLEWDEELRADDECWRPESFMWEPIGTAVAGLRMRQRHIPIRRRYTPAAPAAEGGEQGARPIEWRPFGADIVVLPREIPQRALDAIRDKGGPQAVGYVLAAWPDLIAHAAKPEGEKG